jgi:hypothetical protein
MNNSTRLSSVQVCLEGHCIGDHACVCIAIYGRCANLRTCKNNIFVNFGANVPCIKRSISTEGIRNPGKIDPPN